nr:YesK family protein [Pullulanibacillus pueri]
MCYGTMAFLMSYILTKKSGKRFYAPLVTFIVGGLLLWYSIFIVGGFEGMGYGLVSLGILAVAVFSVVPLAILGKFYTAKQNHYSRIDKVFLGVLPVIFIAGLLFLHHLDDNYWVIDQGAVAVAKSELNQSGYSLSTIGEGKKSLTLTLGKEYRGKKISIEKVKQWRSTTVIVKLTEGGELEKTPFITVGLDEIKEPLTVKTTDGKIFSAFK